MSDLYYIQLLWAVATQMSCACTGEGHAGVGAIAWDSHGERLVVGLPGSAKLALLATDCRPLPTAKLIGWIHGPAPAQAGEADA